MLLRKGFDRPAEIATLHRFSNILEELRAHIITDKIDLAPDLPVGVIGQADPARFCNAFKTGSNVDAVAKDIVVIDDDVADVDADAEFDPLILRHRSVLLGHAALDFNGAAYCIDGAGKLDQHAVAGRLDDAASMGGYRGINEGLSDSLQPGQSAFLVEPIRRLYPATSAARIAASRRSTRSPVKKAPEIGNAAQTIKAYGLSFG